MEGKMLDHIDYERNQFKAGIAEPKKDQNETVIENRQNVVITEINIPLTKLVMFLVKLAIAAVPAVIIVMIFWSLIVGSIYTAISK